jgi:GPH family glycoside/pentoside/hexuronide:cation symporter
MVSSTYLLIQVYLLNFGTDVLAVAPALMGTLLAISRVWDAVSDPMMGALSDGTRSRFGRRRPWMFISAPLYALSFLLLWSSPDSMSGERLYAWMLVMLLLCTTGFTGWMIPHLALGVELSGDHHARNWIFGALSFSWGMGILAAFMFMQYISTADDPRDAGARLGLILVLPTLLVLWVPPVFLRERSRPAGTRPFAPFRAMVDIYRNRRARRLMSVWGLVQVAFALTGITAPYFMIYILERPDLIGFVPFAFFLPASFTMPFWVRMARRFGKRNTWLAAMSLSAVGFGAVAFVGPNEVAFDMAMLVIAGLGSGCATVLGPSILADVTDADELVTGERREGAYAAAWMFIIKAANALAAVLVGVSLQLSGFVAGTALTPTADGIMRIIAAGLPAACIIAAALVFRGFSLDAEEHARIRDQLRVQRLAT